MLEMVLVMGYSKMVLGMEMENNSLFIYLFRNKKNEIFYVPTLNCTIVRNVSRAELSVPSFGYSYSPPRT